MNLEEQVKSILNGLLNLTEDCIVALKLQDFEKLNKLISKRGELIKEFDNLRKRNLNEISALRNRGLFKSLIETILEKSKEFEELLSKHRTLLRRKLENIIKGQKMLEKYKKGVKKIFDKKC